MAVSICELAKIDEIRATAKQDVLRINYLIQRRVWVGVGATTNVRLAFEQRDVEARTGECDCSGKSRKACAKDKDIMRD
jgi:hypothetical protein